MSRKYLTPVDLTGNELQNAVIQNLGTAPSLPTSGRVYYDTGANRLYYYNGSVFVLKATDSDLLNGQPGTFYLARANHTGTQLAATISNFDTQVRTSRLDQMAAPTSSVSFNSQLITNVSTPMSPGDAANKAYVDANIQGLSPKPTAQATTATALPANTYNNGSNGVGATLTATSNAALVVDGYTVAVGDIILVRLEATTANNGLYNVTQAGSASTPYTLTRNGDMDQATEFGGGFVAVENRGSTLYNSLWLCQAAASITVGTTAVSFTQLNASTALMGSSTVLISGNVASVITQAGGGITSGASGLLLDTTVAVRKFAQAFGDGSATSYTITHNLGTQDVAVAVYLATTPFNEVECDVGHASASTISLAFSVAPTSNQYRVVVHG